MIELNRLWTLVVDKGASDVLFLVGHPPMIKLQGDLRPLKLPSISSEDMGRILEGLTPPEIQDRIKQSGRG